MTDLALSASGDLVPNGIGGFLLVKDAALDMQDIAYRAQTNNPDQPAHLLGANLEDLIGLPNNQDTGNRGCVQLAKALSYDGRFSRSGIKVTSTPLSLNKIEFKVDVIDPVVNATGIVFTTVLDLEG